MLTPPDLSADAITACLSDNYRLRVLQVTFLPIGADVNSAVYRIEAEDCTPYFLKVRRDDFAEVAVAVPAFLRAQGIQQVMVPLPTVTGRLWASAHGFEWILYPFFEGNNGFAQVPTAAQWAALGRTVKAVHLVVLPAELERMVPREVYSPRWRDIVSEFGRDAGTRAYDDSIARKLAAFWLAQREEIDTMVARAGQLADDLRRRALPFVLCHTDLHVGNVLLGPDGELVVVDWDNPLLAPKERDLMFVGGGVGATWDVAAEEAAFYDGYDPTEIDLTALAYYRYERIVEDFAAYGAQIFGAQGSVVDRENGLRKVMGQFLPDGVIPIAQRTYWKLVRG